jgi:hypothetical protein
MFLCRRGDLHKEMISDNISEDLRHYMFASNSKRNGKGNHRRHATFGPVLGILPIPVAVRSKTWVCGRSLTRIVRSNPSEGMDVCLL